MTEGSAMIEKEWRWCRRDVAVGGQTLSLTDSVPGPNDEVNEDRAWEEWRRDQVTIAEITAHRDIEGAVSPWTWYLALQNSRLWIEFKAWRSPRSPSSMAKWAETGRRMDRVLSECLGLLSSYEDERLQ
jgi:hypothetical protein